ncbi:hypothetical protein [Streptomyces sp. NPDC047315]|uniref:hypothetical protein n=1 Tax=Streptomyces sp. NPDC047315 TaxID=3155142 RepID=UPI0033C7FF04
MTAPLTPPHQPHRDSGEPDPWRAPPPVEDGHDDASAGEELRADLRDGAVVVVAVSVLGVALGLLWLWLAPKVPLISNGREIYLRDTEGEEAIGADGTFALLGFVFGAISAAGVFWWRRRGGLVQVVALAIGGLLAGLVAWRVGVWLGPTTDVVAHAKAVGPGVAFDGPLELRAYGVLVAWPLSAMLAHLLLTALFAPRDPPPPPVHPPHWGPLT